LSYKFLDHATDAIIEVKGKDLKEAFAVTADAVINLTLIKIKSKKNKLRNFQLKEKICIIFFLVG